MLELTNSPLHAGQVWRSISAAYSPDIHPAQYQVQDNIPARRSSGYDNDICHWLITSLHGGQQCSCTPYTSTRNESEPLKKKPSLRERLMSKRAEVAEGSRTTNSPLQMAKKEMDRYLSVPCEELSINPLDWRKASSKTYPNLSQVAWKYLCTTATSTPSERQFSTAGEIITSKRNFLKPELAGTLIFPIRNAWYCWFLSDSKNTTKNQSKPIPSLWI